MANQMTAYEQLCFDEVKHWMGEVREAQLDWDADAERKAKYMLNMWSDRLDQERFTNGSSKRKDDQK
jgi:hypothetical protein